MANGLSAVFANFLRWWGAELKGLLPRAMLTPFAHYQRRLILSVEAGRFRLLAGREGQLEALPPPADADEALLQLAGAARARPGAVIGLRFAPAECFTRTIELPAAAERDFGRILDLDLERSTPFRRDAVLSAHYVDAAAPAARGKRLVRQVIVKRESVEPLLGKMRELGIPGTFAGCWDSAGAAPLPVDFLAGGTARAARNGGRLVPAIAALTAVLLISALGTYIVRHQNALDHLEVRAAGAKAEAQKVRAALAGTQDAAARIAALENLARARISAALILKELTEVIPDSAWLSDLRIDGGTVEFTGFARSAAALIPLLEQSRLFTAATLTSPVVLDGGEDKERFSIRVRLRDLPEAVAGKGEL